jgi:hypothetical protein
MKNLKLSVKLIGGLNMFLTLGVRGVERNSDRYSYERDWKAYQDLPQREIDIPNGVKGREFQDGK